jgi:hypothetical protein
VLQCLFIYLKAQHLHIPGSDYPWGPGGGDAAALAFDVPEKRWRDGERWCEDSLPCRCGCVCVGGSW